MGMEGGGLRKEREGIGGPCGLSRTERPAGTGVMPLRVAAAPGVLYAGTSFLPLVPKDSGIGPIAEVTMQRRLQWLCLTVLACLTLAACANPDQRLASKVKARLADEGTVPAATITVESHQGVVTLTGNVDTPEQKARAIEVARSTEGVQDVVDQIAAARENGTGDAPDTDRTVGEALDDAAIT